MRLKNTHITIRYHLRSQHLRLHRVNFEYSQDTIDGIFSCYKGSDKNDRAHYPSLNTKLHELHITDPRLAIGETFA